MAASSDLVAVDKLLLNMHRITSICRIYDINAFIIRCVC